MIIISIFTLYYPDMGGIQSVIKNLSENLIKMGHSAKVICFINKNAPSFEIINGVEVFRIKDNYYNYLMDYSLEFSRFFQMHKELFDEADIINVHSYHTLFSWQVIRFLNKKGYANKIIFTPHYEGIGFSFVTNFLHKIYKIIAKSSFKIPRAIVCVSNYEKINICTRFGEFERKICVIPNGIEYNIPNFSVIKKLSKSKIRLLYVGRIEKKKGIQYVLEMIEYFTNKYPSKIEFNVAGTGSYLGELQNITKKYNINSVHFLGTVSNEKLEYLYKNSDIFILLSKSEAYGIVVAEALSHGLVTILSNTTALTEFVKEDGCFGVDFPPNIKELGDLIYDLICLDQISIGPFDENKICSWENVTKKYILLYNSIISTS